jgi:hypothetical protein
MQDLFQRILTVYYRVQKISALDATLMVDELESEEQLPLSQKPGNGSDPPANRIQPTPQHTAVL